MMEVITDKEMIAAANRLAQPDAAARHAAARRRRPRYAVFMAHPSGWLICLFILVIGGVRCGGAAGLDDVLIAVVIVAYFPFNEWLIHVFMLHYKPRQDLRPHHRLLPAENPSPPSRRSLNLKWVFIPRHIHAWTPVSIGLILLLAWPFKEQALTGITVYLILGLHYEWVHFLAHIPGARRLADYQKRVREHRYHHFKNENYWWGVSMGTGDPRPAHRAGPGSRWRARHQRHPGIELNELLSFGKRAMPAMNLQRSYRGHGPLTKVNQMVARPVASAAP